MSRRGSEHGYSPSRPYQSTTPITSSYQAYTSPYPQQPQLYSSALRSGSRIGDLNQRLMQQTDLIRMRNSSRRKQWDTRSTSSEMRRSRYSGQKIVPIYKQEMASNSLAGSRLSEQVLSIPVIQHSSVVSRPILTPQGGYLQASPHFYKPNVAQPSASPSQIAHVTRQAVNPTLGGRSLFQQRSSNIPAQIGSNEDSMDQFLDMDTHTDTRMRVGSASMPQGPQPGGNAYNNSEREPVSPVTPLKGDTFRMGAGETAKSDRSYTRKGAGLQERVKQMLAKVDSDGKLITIVLVSLGVVLVLLQAIR